MANGADLLELKCSHPDLGDFSFDCKSNEGCPIKGGGYRKNSDANGITGNGKAIFTINATRWSAQPTITARTGDDADVFLRKLSLSAKEGTWTLAYVDDVVKQAKGSVVDDWELDSNAGTGQLTLEGGGEVVTL
jgi:hypothetical protein